jgi:methyl-accepting chemotaxis protein
MAAALRRIAAGDFSARAGIEHHRGEFSQLAAAFDEMADSLENITRIQRTTAEELQAISGMCSRWF